MELRKIEHSSQTPPETSNPEAKKWREVLRQWLVQCPECTEVRLVVGLQENDQYICKDCGNSFVIGFQSRDGPLAS